MTFLTEGFEILLLVIGAGAFAYEMVYSDISSIIKRFFFLDKENVFVKWSASPKVWFKVFGKWSLLFLWLIIPIVVLSKAHRFLFKVLWCLYCSTFWLSLTVALLLGNAFLSSILISSTAMFFAGVYNLIRKYAA